jgi:hypothetical protein
LTYTARREYSPPSRSKGFRDTIDILLSYPVLTGFWEYVCIIVEFVWRDYMEAMCMWERVTDDMG